MTEEEDKYREHIEEINSLWEKQVDREVEELIKQKYKKHAQTKSQQESRKSRQSSME